MLPAMQEAKSLEAKPLQQCNAILIPVSARKGNPEILSIHHLLYLP